MYTTPQFGAMHWRTAVFLVGLSVVLLLLLYNGYIHGSYWVALIPGFYAWARPSLYRLICDATYHAHHRFELDMCDREEINAKDRMNQVVTLDAESFLSKLKLDDEMVGRA